MTATCCPGLVTPRPSVATVQSTPPAQTGRARRQAQLRRAFRREPAHHGGGVDDAVRHHRARDAQRLHQLAAPAAALHVEDAAQVARRGIVDRDLPRHPVDGVGVRRQKAPDSGPVLRLVLLDPEDLRVAVVGVEAVAGDAVEPVEADAVFHHAADVVRAAVHPDHAGPHRPHLVVERHARAPVESADADAADRFRRNPRLFHRVADGGLHRLHPHLRPLLGPERPGRRHAVFGERGGQQGAVRIHDDGFRARRADVRSDQIVHFRASLFLPAALRAGQSIPFSYSQMRRTFGADRDCGSNSSLR